MRTKLAALVLVCLAAVFMALPQANASVTLIANGTLTGSTAGSYSDLSGLNYTLENGVSASLLGGLGSGMAWASGNTFLALPDRGPNAVSYNSAVDDTVSYITRFHTVTMNLQPNTGSGLPFLLTPTLKSTTLLSTAWPLVYGTGTGVGLGSGAPAQNNPVRNYFTGRSDNFDPAQSSGNSLDARFDTEGIRVSNDGRWVYISDEYGPYVYEFSRATGARFRSFALPPHLFVSNLYPVGSTEIANNTSGRTANKGMEGLAITPDGKTLLGFMQASLIQDANQGGKGKKVLRFVTIDIATGQWTHEYAYNLTTGSGVSEVVAINNHEFLVDERDGNGLGNGNAAVVKQFFKIDIANAVDVSNMDGLTAAAHAVSKSLWLDIVAALNAVGIPSTQIPAKIEGVAFGSDVNYKGTVLHTLWVANDNDFLQDYSGPNTNPNQFYVFGFTSADLPTYVPQAFTIH
jgi:hypothetical protein